MVVAGPLKVWMRRSTIVQQSDVATFYDEMSFLYE